ncbi:hypothetical protein FSP39_025319 [Pinctada imbricata]|uniref:Uncharacterized protein n=1 Tax=Pinctada imbricata TaxID=66713 RepID=A0AA88YJC6_PINIB|nr:hypothetical protein FSP39_025319 [Pinctada imbricata]
MLLTLLTGQRAQTIHLLKVSDVNISNVDVRIVYSSLLKTTRPGFHLSDSIIHAFDSDDALCLVKTLTRYLLVSETLRHENCDELFIGTMKPFKGVSRDTVRRWIKTVMKNAGVDIQVFKPHSTRAASTSAAKQAGVQISDIMKCAACQNFKYGIACDKNCDCDRTNSRSCDSETGECLCKPGWAGEKCRCKAGLECDPRYSSCRGDTCICKEGYYQEGVSCSGLSDVIYYCSFESTNISTCNIKHIGVNNTFQWQRHTDSTPSSYTGPVDAYDRKYYFYAEATGRSPGEDAELLIDGIKTRTSSCMEMNYHMKGSDMGDLVVIVIHDDTYTNWNVSGSQGSAWKKLTLNIPKSEKIKIYIIGVKGTDYKSDIAIDNIWMFARPCDVNECTSGIVSCLSEFSQCINLEGSYKCICRGAKIGDGQFCSDKPVFLSDKSDEDYSSILLWKTQKWMPVCNNSWDVEDARVLCKQMYGLSYGLSISRSEEMIANISNPQHYTIGLGDFQCKGSESSLLDCPHFYSYCGRGKADVAGVRCNACGGKFTKKVGYLESSKQAYYHLTSCDFLISRPALSLLNITFKTFIIEDSDNCTKDYVEIFDGGSESAPSMGRYCGKMDEFSLTSSGPQLLLRFKTDHSVNQEGFRALYQSYYPGLVIGDRCGAGDTCLPDNSSCIRGICQCQRPFYHVGDTSCMPRKCGVGDTCLPADSSCIHGICQCQRPFYHVGDTSCMPRKLKYSSLQ